MLTETSISALVYLCLAGSILLTLFFAFCWYMNGIKYNHLLFLSCVNNAGFQYFGDTWIGVEQYSYGWRSDGFFMQTAFDEVRNNIIAEIKSADNYQNYPFHDCFDPEPYEGSFSSGVDRGFKARH